MVTLTYPTLLQFIRIWTYIGLLSFGGPAAQIALMHRIVVEEKKWLSETQFLNALNFCLLLPGPEAMQLATYCGWKKYGILGGLISGGLFVLPGAAVMLMLAMIYVHYADFSGFQAAFWGIKSAVIIVILQAIWRIAQKTLLSRRHIFITAASFIALFFFQTPYPMLIIAAGLAGYFLLPKDVSDSNNPIQRPRSINFSKTLLIGLLAWLSPLGVLYIWQGDSLLFEIGAFFAILAILSFGGAYAALGYMTQVFVHEKHWLSTAQIADGLGLAETTPGPVILATEFSAYLAAYLAHGPWYALLAAMIALWMIFVPCYLWIFLGAPYLQWLTHLRILKNMLSGIGAAVVGVMLNLAIWFLLSIYFGEWQFIDAGPIHFPQIEWLQFNVKAFFISLVAGVLLFKTRFGLTYVLLGCAMLSLSIQLISA